MIYLEITGPSGGECFRGGWGKYVAFSKCFLDVRSISAVVEIVWGAKAFLLNCFELDWLRRSPRVRIPGSLMVAEAAVTWRGGGEGECVVSGDRDSRVVLSCLFGSDNNKGEKSFLAETIYVILYRNVKLRSCSYFIYSLFHLGKEIGMMNLVSHCLSCHRVCLLVLHHYYCSSFH